MSNETTSRSQTSQAQQPQKRCSECIDTAPAWTHTLQCVYCGREIEPHFETPEIDSSYRPTIGDLVAVAAMQ